MEEGNDSSLEFSSTSNVDSSWGECLPDNRFANVRSDKKRDTRAQTIALEEAIENFPDYQKLFLEIPLRGAHQEGGRSFQRQKVE